MNIVKKSFQTASIILLLVLLLSGFTNPAAAQDANFLVEVNNTEGTPEKDPCIAYIQPFLVGPGEVTPAPSPSPSTSPSASGPSTFADAEFTVNPPHECITEQLRYIEIGFHGLTANQGDYRLCTGSEACLATDPNQPGIPTFFVDLINAPGETNQEGTITIPVCGDGDKKVKTGCEGENWFHGGNVYFVSIGTVNNDIYKPLKRGGFYVSRYYPEVTISPSENLTIDTGSITVSLSGERPGGEKRNNYQVLMVGGEGYGEGKCINTNESHTFTGINRVGTYNIIISERINEPSAGSLIGGIGYLAAGGLIGNELLNLAGVRDGFDKINQNLKGCQGGFTYYQIACTITNRNAETKGSCENPYDGADPEGVEYRAFLKELAKLNSIFGTSLSFPCEDGVQSSARTLGGCKTFNTALGPIEVTPEGFIRTIFGWVLTLASFGAIIVIIYAGYTFMTSRGDKEKVQAARETITSAIVGLLFIILSIVILEIIGVDVLAIPGFGR